MSTASDAFTTTVDRGDGTDVLLKCESASINRGKREIVHAASCVLRKGEVVALLGPNGAGKSTLLDALSGALELRSGEVHRHGRVAIALQAADLAHRSVLANVKLALTWWGVPREQRTDRALAALRLISAEHLAGRDALTLSGGERRRVHLARVLAVEPDVLLLDEPFAGLDAETRAGLLQDTVSALRSKDRATLVVVHDRAEAWALADRFADHDRRAHRCLRPTPRRARAPPNRDRGPISRLRRRVARR